MTTKDQAHVLQINVICRFESRRDVENGQFIL